MEKLVKCHFWKNGVSAPGLVIGLQSIASNNKIVEKVVRSFIILTERKEVQGKNSSSPYVSYWTHQILVLILSVRKKSFVGGDFIATSVAWFEFFPNG